MNQCYFNTHLSFFIHVPGEGDSVIRNLFNVANRVKALLVIGCDMKKEKGIKRISVTGRHVLNYHFSSGEMATLPILLSVSMATVKDLCLLIIFY